jgi:putative transcriptional regulator
MPITHHPPDDTVLRYANGTLPEAPAVVVATHLSFCPGCRHRMETYEMLGGSLLDDVAPSKLSADALSATLARLDAAALTVGSGAVGSGTIGVRNTGVMPTGARHPGATDVRGAVSQRPAGQPPAPALRQRPDLPAGMEWPGPLRHYDIPRWRFVLPGVKWAALPVTGPESGQLLLVRGIPGAKLPAHGHDGTEYTCVLTGAFSDSNGTYTVGDLIEASEDHDHQPIVTPDAECVCLIAIDGHLRLHGLARLLQPFLGV